MPDCSKDGVCKISPDNNNNSDGVVDDNDDAVSEHLTQHRLHKRPPSKYGLLLGYSNNNPMCPTKRLNATTRVHKTMILIGMTIHNICVYVDNLNSIEQIQHCF